VTVKAGKRKGGDFDRVKACRKRGQIGCVAAFSAFNGPVPEDAVFGRTSEPGLEVLCTDPAKLGARSGVVKTVYPSEPFAPGTIATAISLVAPPPPAVSTLWLQYKDAYRTSCSSAAGASVLQVAAQPGAVKLTPVPNAAWGLHLADVNIALGNLNDMVRRQARRFVRERG
ncbi:MAG TPA: hypothetical protein VK919_04200, partial [Solirubrobacterales bacterium]|nr:hypothetical protein [Solirubrobacterales bacterium]